MNDSIDLPFLLRYRRTRVSQEFIYDFLQNSVMYCAKILFNLRKHVYYMGLMFRLMSLQKEQRKKLLEIEFK